MLLLYDLIVEAFLLLPIKINNDLGEALAPGTLRRNSS
jgi:hypothetical protein